jgi:hypothetical protein
MPNLFSIYLTFDFDPGREIMIGDPMGLGKTFNPLARHRFSAFVAPTSQFLANAMKQS